MRLQNRGEDNIRWTESREDNMKKRDIDIKVGFDIVLRNIDIDL